MNTTRNQTHTNNLIMIVLSKAGITKDMAQPTIIKKATGVKLGKVLLTTVEEAIQYRIHYQNTL